jgi:hypothetical protein
MISVVNCLAISIAMAVLPTAVGPAIIITVFLTNRKIKF